MSVYRENGRFAKPPSRYKSEDESRLKTIRQRYTYALSQWKETRDEAKLDMKYVSGDPWTEQDKRMRQDAGRPMISLDEISQYLNQAINNVRQSKVGIKVEPAGNQATDKTAEANENLIRSIEYKSNAWRNAYLPAYENALQRSYGFFKITREYESEKSFNQIIRIVGILNADSVLYDPDCREADWSDADYCFELEPISKEEFKRKYPNAQIRDFTAEDAKLAPDWIREDHIVLAAYWEAEAEEKKLFLVDSGAGPVAMMEDELPEGTPKEQIIKERSVTTRKIVQYVTNGVEILETNPQPGSFIPVIPVIGKEMYVDDGSGPKRKLISMVRMARDAQMLYNYLASQEAEEASLSPKVAYQGYKGQFDADRDAYDTAHKIPHSTLQVAIPEDWNPGWGPPPLPSRPQFIPNFQAYEIAKDSARRAIMSAMGTSPLPTAAQRQNEKSGKALERIQSEQSIGSFHFTDNLYRALELAGKLIEQWRPVVYDTERELGVKKANGDHEMIKINTPQPYQDESGEEKHFPMDVGQHDITISVGPSFQSEREAAADFADTLVQHAPDIFPLIGDLLVRMRNLGPLGDEIADRLTPPQFAKPGSPQAAQAGQQQAQQHMQQLQLFTQQLQQELQKLQMEKQGKVIENQTKLEIEKARFSAANELEKIKLQVQVTIAEIQTKAQNERERMKWEHEAANELHVSAHEAAMQAVEHSHEHDLADQQAQAAQAQQAQAAEPQPAQ